MVPWRAFEKPCGHIIADTKLRYPGTKDAQYLEQSTYVGVPQEVCRQKLAHLQQHSDC